MTRTAISVVARLLVGLVLCVVGAVAYGVQAASAAEPAVSTYTVGGVVQRDGSLDVQVTMDLEGSPGEVQQQFATTLNSGRDQQYQFTLSDWKVSVGGQDVAADVTSASKYQTLRIPLAGRTGPVVFSYRVRGAAFDNEDGTTTLNWRLLQGLSLPVRSFDAEIKTPGLFVSMDCYAGRAANPDTCSSYAGGTHDQPDPVFHDEARAPGEVVGIVIRFDGALVRSDQVLRQLWTLDNAFSADPVPLVTAAAVALAGALVYWMVHRRFGRDEASGPPIVVGSFRPVGNGQSEFTLADDVRPGEIGTLADERVDPIDVTASVLDLAVRNHILIEELPREGRFKPTDWALSRHESGAALLPYERTLLDAIAPASGERRRLAEFGPALVAALPMIQAQLYDEVVRKGWFRSRPDAVRTRWSRLGWLAVGLAAVAAALLIAFTRFGLTGLVVLVLAAAVGFVGQHMPARTARGAATLTGLGALRVQLLTQPTDELPHGREHEELSQVLPYAVVLGGADRWLDAIAGVNDGDVDDAQELSWYHGPEGWRLSDLPDSLRNFIRAFQGTIVART